MPELPRLEVVCRVLNRRIAGKMIVAAEVIPPRGAIVVRDLTSAGFGEALSGVRFAVLHRTPIMDFPTYETVGELQLTYRLAGGLVFGNRAILGSTGWRLSWGSLTAGGGRAAPGGAGPRSGQARCYAGIGNETPTCCRYAIMSLGGQSSAILPLTTRYSDTTGPDASLPAFVTV